MADHIHEGDMDVVRCPQCSPGLVETETFRTTYKRRECCDSTEAQWHSRPCAVDGDQGPVGMNDWPPHEKLFAVTNPEPPSYMERMYAVNMRLIPYRSCCDSLFGLDAHLSSCMSRFFADGQRVVKPSIAGLAYPWERAPLRVCEDTGSSDRTFENETRPL
jgi:hypothetical protein